jgi:G6PDH family F420-dependent oxidoreductase
MTSYGFTLSSEEHPPLELVELAARAEAEGFDFVSISDHFHPWIERQGHSPFVWAVLGGIAARTERIRVGVGVTCPIQRIHPVIIAQASATVASMLPGRFFFGVGTGEALNEHVTGERWPAPEERLERLDEAVGIIRRLWTGETVDHRGGAFTVENARLYTVPDVLPEIVVSAFGPKAVELAARIGDGLWTSSPSPDTVEAYRKAGGTGPVVGQLTVCWHEDPAAARKIAHEVWPNTSVPGQLSQDLPTPTHFEQACGLVTEEQVAEKIPCGPDVDAIVEQLRRFEDAGYTDVHVHQVGPDQESFFEMWRGELRPRLTHAGVGSAR